MSNNSRHSFKMQKKFHKEQTALRARAGKTTDAPEKQPSEQMEPQTKSFHAPAGPPP